MQGPKQRGHRGHHLILRAFPASGSRSRNLGLSDQAANENAKAAR